MGMYTDLECRAIIKEKYRNRIRQIVFVDKSMLEYDLDHLWESLFPDDFADEFVTDERSWFIPWGENCLNQEEIFDGTTLRVECSIKNYTDTYSKFYEFLKEISDEIIEFKTYYEENYEYDRTEDCYVYFWYNYLIDEYEEHKCKIFT